MRAWQTGAYGELAHLANWLIWQTDYGESAYGKLAYGKMTSYLVLQL